MPLVAAAVCPHPPMLVPEVAAGAAAELESLREACVTAVRTLVDSGARSLIVVGSGPNVTVHQSGVSASFAGYGVPLAITLDRATAVAAQPLPLSLTVAAWLLRDVELPIAMHTVAWDLPAAECARWRPHSANDAEASDTGAADTGVDAAKTADTGAADANTGSAEASDTGAADTEPWALLAMGDASACRSPKAPGYFDPDALTFDEAVAVALAAGDTSALLALDPALAQRLWCAGRPAWQAMAGRIAATGQRWTGELLHHDAPYGVGYLVATLAPQLAPRLAPQLAPDAAARTS